jgi:hypothetical protein
MNLGPPKVKFVKKEQRVSAAIKKDPIIAKAFFSSSLAQPKQDQVPKADISTEELNAIKTYLMPPEFIPKPPPRNSKK